jgi:hypothetical protein
MILDSSETGCKSTRIVELSSLIPTEVQFRSETYQRFFRRLAPDVVGTPYETCGRDTSKSAKPEPEWHNSGANLCFANCNVICFYAG